MCPYHAWRYGIDGSLQHARNADKVQRFDRSEFSLVPIKVENFLGVIMFNLNPDATSFAGQLPGLAAEIHGAVSNFDELVLEEAASGGFTGGSPLECNWKMLVDNCVECYHCTPSHPAFVDLVDIGSYQITLHQRHSSHLGVPTKPENAAYHHTEDQGGFAFWHVWPNITFGTFPGSPNFGAFCARPVSATRTCARGFRLRLPAPETPEEERRRRYMDEILWPEDKGICESVQRGMRSRSYNQGPLLAQPPHDGLSEAVVHLFQQRTLEVLGELE